MSTPKGAQTRPTTDRVRESAFQLIADWAGTAGEAGADMLDRFSFLDLYAGSGAVALEAASRGAAPVVAVEKDRRVAALIRENARTTELPVVVRAAAVKDYLAGAATRFDIVWLDPPYVLSDRVVASVVAAVASRWLASDGLVVVERSARTGEVSWPSILGNRWSRRYGETMLFMATQEM